MKKLTVRLSDKSANLLKKYQIIFNIRHKNISLNTLINLLIYFKIPRIKIDEKYLRYFNTFKKRLTELRGADFYNNYSKKLVALTNSLNSFNRKISGACNNLNQIAKSLNSQPTLNEYDYLKLRKDMDTCKSYLFEMSCICTILQKKVAKLWEM